MKVVLLPFRGAAMISMVHFSTVLGTKVNSGLQMPLPQFPTAEKFIQIVKA